MRNIQLDQSVFGRVIADRRGLITVTYIGLLVAVCILAPLIAPYNPNAQSDHPLLGFGATGHLLGTDDLGRDVLSRLIFGTRVSMTAATVAVAVALVIGLPLGILAGYVGRWVDVILMRISDTLLSFPGLIFAIAVTAALGPGITKAMAAIGIVYAPSVARLIRAQVLSLKGEPYMDASRTFGSTHRHLIIRHVVPNAIQPVVVQAALLLARALIAEGSLSFLGLGAQPPTASWGAMLARAYAFIRQEPLQMLVPGLAIAITALAFNVLGDVAQTAMDPRRRRSRRPTHAAPKGTATSPNPAS